MRADEATQRTDAAMLEILAIHDAIKHGNGIQADFPYPHNWNAHRVVDLLDQAFRAAAEASRLLSKVTTP